MGLLGKKEVQVGQVEGLLKRSAELSTAKSSILEGAVSMISQLEETEQQMQTVQAEIKQVMATLADEGKAVAENLAHTQVVKSNLKQLFDM